MGKKARAKRSINKHHFYHPKKLYERLGLPNRIMFIPVALHEEYNFHFDHNCKYRKAVDRKCNRRDSYCPFLNLCCYFRRPEEYGEVIQK